MNEDELFIRPMPGEDHAKIASARFRPSYDGREIAADRRAILTELEQRAADNPRYNNWPEQVPGVPVGFLPGEAGLMCYDLRTHRLVIGRSDAGKATSVIALMLLHDDSHACVIVDPKDGAVTRATAGYRQTLGPVHVVDPLNKTGFFPDGGSDAYNPFACLDPNDDELELKAANLASALCYLPDGTGDDNKYWDRQGRRFTTALIVYLVTARHETGTIERLSEILSLPPTDFIEQVAMPMARSPRKFVAKTANEFRGYGMSNPKGFGDVFATVRSYMEWTDFRPLQRVTERSTFSFEEVRQNGGTVYIVMDDDKLNECASWLRLMLQSARLGLKRSASHRPVHFVIDEAAALGKLDLITTGLRAWRSAGIRLHLFYQDVAQIISAFKDAASSITNTDVLQFLGCNPGDYETAEFISKIFGERDVIVPTTGEGSSRTRGESASHASGTSLTNTAGTSTNESRSQTTTKSASWSSTTGHSRTVGTTETESISTSSSSGKSSTNGPGGLSWGSNSSTGTSSSSSFSLNKSETVSESETTGESRSFAFGQTVGTGTNQSRAEGTSTTETNGTSTSEGNTDNRSFTIQLRKSFRPEQVRMMPADQMIVIAGNAEPALLHKEHFYKNPRLVARAMIPFRRND